jgi:probable HAF family extracellular repeat protein
MRFRTFCVTAMTLFAALAVPTPLAAQNNQGHSDNKLHHHYKVIEIGTLGGPNSGVSLEPTVRVLSSQGIVAGCAETPTPDPNSQNPNPFLVQDPLIQHTVQWKNGVLTDLGALPGGNNSCLDGLQQTAAISGNGLIVGASENGAVDPLTGYPEVRAVLWKEGQIIDLGTLGGNESFAISVNNRGQVTGATADAIPDPLSFFGFGTETRAFLWHNGVMQDLGTLGGPDAFGIDINDRGQVFGVSYLNSTPNSTTGIPTVDGFLWENGTMADIPDPLGGTLVNPSHLNNKGQAVGNVSLLGDVEVHPFLWEKGMFTDLGTFGGTFGSATEVNEVGQVVGNATYPGDTILRAFLWQDGVKSDLGTLGSDACSQAYAINAHSQVVGWSGGCDLSGIRAFLSENGGSMIDLNTLIPANSGISLITASNINDRGEIVGVGGLSNGDLRAFLLIPCEEGEEACEDADEGTVSAIQNNPAPAINCPTTSPQHRLAPGGMTAAWRAQMARRYHIPGVAAPK